MVWSDTGFAGAIGVAVFAVVLWPAAMLNDGDTLSHIQTGAWILAHQTIPRTDPFSFTFFGRPWVAHEWLAELVLALAYRAAGWSGVMGLTAASAGVAAGLLTWCLCRFASAKVTLLLLVFALTVWASSLLARPHLLALPCLMAWSAGLVVARARGKAPSLMLLPVMTVWSNLHGGFIVGLGLTVALGGEAIVEAMPRPGQAALCWGRFLAGSIVAASITPRGPASLLFPFELVAMKELSHVPEWAPSDLGHVTPVTIAILLGLYFAMIGQIRLPRFRALLLTGLLFVTFQHSRNDQLLATIGPMLAVGAHGERRETTVPSSNRWRRFGWPALGTIAAIALIVRLAIPFDRADGSVYPVTAFDHVPASLRSQPVFNDYGFGGFLIFSGVRPFIDGRADMFGDAFLGNYRDVMHLKPGALDPLLAGYRIGWTMLAPENPIVGLMDREPGWHRLYADKFAVIHIRDAVPQSN